VQELAQGPYAVTVSDEAQTCTIHVTGRALYNQSATVLKESVY